MAKIELQNVSYVYNRGTAMETVALDHVDAVIRDHAITGIIGHTGSGKSTLIQLFNGLAKPSAGKILLDGLDLNATVKDVYPLWKDTEPYVGLRRGKALKQMKKALTERTRTLCFHVGLVMQYPEYQLFEETVAKDIAFGPRNMGLDEEEIALRVKEAADFVGLTPDVMDKSPFDLSGGQKRRVALAGIIAMKPEVLVLDEPAAGLDPLGRDTVFAGIVNYQRSTGATVIIVSHSMEDMAKYADDVLVLSHGKKIASGNVNAVFSAIDTLIETGLNAPQVTRLMALLRQGGMPIPDGIYTVASGVETLTRLFEEVAK